MPTDDPRPKRNDAAPSPAFDVPPGVDPEYAKYWDPALHEAARKKRRGFKALRAKILAEHPLPKDPKKLRRLVQHQFLYDKHGLPK